MAATLSFCIPTYNRAPELEQLLLSIEAAIAASGRPPSDFEVCIADNASTDRTQDLAALWAERLACKTKYVRSPVNLGPDKNFLKAASLASLEFCWLLGSDDALTPDAISRALSLVGSSDVVLCNRHECDVDLRPISKNYWLDPSIQTTSVDFSNDDDLCRYLSRSKSLGALFSYLSCIIVRRSLWMQVTDPERFVGTAYPHTYVVLRGLRRGGSLLYVNEHWVLNRQGNDHFMADGHANRVLLDLCGYPKISYAVFPESPSIRRMIRRVIQIERPFNHIKNLYRGTERRSWIKLTRILRSAGYSRTLVARALTRGIFRLASAAKRTPIPHTYAAKSEL